MPLFDDQERLCRQLEALTPDGAITQLFASDPNEEFVVVDGAGDLATWTFSEPARVVVLSDLGVLQRGGSDRLRRRWYGWGRRLADQGFSLVALVPFPVQVAGSDLRRVFTIVPWQRSAKHYVHEVVRRAQLVEQVLVTASPVVRLEPGLLRMLRSSIPEALDASLECDVWQHPVVTSRHVDAATLDRRSMEKQFCPAFAKLPPDQRGRLLTAIRAWRFDFSDSPEVWFQEVLNLDRDSQGIVEELFPGDLQDAIAGLHHLATRAKPKDDSRYSLRLREYGGRAADWLSESAWRDPRIRKAIHDLWNVAPHKLRRERGGLDPALLGGQGEPTCVTLTQVGCELYFSASRRSATSYLGSLWTRNGWFDVESVVPDKNSFWKSGRPPAWAHNWGRDKYGAYVHIHVSVSASDARHTDLPEQVVTQRLRWIPAGKFLMGSPENEKGRYGDEGPQREVTLTRGYWMLDTPVTQQLWQAVMGNNPSRFKGVRRPVEKVSWDEAQEFINRLNERLGETAFVLPSEAQWEYACRAGTTTRYAFGDAEAVLKDHAWYGVNSGGETHDVGTKLANAWGLFDMHGNVLEWCQDYWADDYSNTAAVDPAGPSQGHGRVVRGGSWSRDARRVRSAYRCHFEPGDRLGGIGFRCAQVQAAAEPTEEAGEAAEPQARSTNGGEAAAIKIDSEAPQHTSIPADPVIIVRSDVDSLELRRIPKPDWATAIGRDRYGLWAEFGVQTELPEEEAHEQEGFWDKIRQTWRRGQQRPSSSQGASQHTVVQRMRWIAPGRFLMGTSTGDEMAYDDEHPQHEVTLTHGFWLFDTPVTQQLWLAVMKENPSHFQGALRPVERVSWDDCRVFLRKINEEVSELNLSLPTEAEWEYACRAGTSSHYAFGDRISRDQANYYEGEAENHETSDVKTFAPNGWGLFDMLGNVWEWCQDWFDSGAYKSNIAVDSIGPAEGHDRVLRGGSWNDRAQFVRSAYRSHFEPGVKYGYFGFRCAQVQD